ncbi:MULTISPECIES: molybdopterin cofactor-binding domain-containing protein [Mesorhizobium]|uniref:xanthine dehydrogenase family protein molybdopterin-binding subunit n=1 Tax=Mesorhizobium TaxID=68287 RepID=UPI0007FCFD24|nr:MULTISPECIES: molybdopterin cofactor-binding domain-containing protein [Mesorhizobium]MUT27283.1 molybdopterin-dependent oxidoreductase [Mesorhizobium japonicum]OBQ83746.1 aldehyde oxidase [Mesorhizobium sp. WSM3873]
MNGRVSRRQFIAAAAGAGISVKIGFLGRPASKALIANRSDGSPSWIGPDGRPRFRIDAVAKVTGDKTFTRDFRARDVVGWPQEQSHAFLIRGTRANAPFDGLDLSLLGENLKPDRLVLGEDLVRDGLVPPETAAAGFYGDMFLVPKGRTPRLLGQPVALLIYKDFARFDAAKRLVRFADGVVRWGAVGGYDTPPHYGAGRVVRMVGAVSDDPDNYAPLEKGTTMYGDFDADQVVWPKPDQSGDAEARAMWAAGEIEREIAATGDDALVLKRSYFSQSTDASSMEADNGNIWFEPGSSTLHAIIATQSPYEVANSTLEMLSKSRFAVKALDLSIGYTVGYGTKNHSIFPYYAVLAGLYGDGRPVRLANDRFEQFQMGLKRHAFWMENTLVVDRSTHAFRIMKGSYRTDAGGRRNVSPDVGNVGASAARNIYYLPKSDFSVEVRASRAVDAGSTRGYGALQTMAATEMMVDEAAELLGIDPIELRLKNAFKAGMKNAQGAIPGGALRTEEILERARAHSLWKDRAAKKTAFDTANRGKRYGVGFAQVQKDYGTRADAAVTTLSLDPNGRLTMRQNGNDIGTGLTTSQAVVVADIIGRVPDECAFGVVDWPEMPLVSTEKPYTTPQEEEDALAQNPRWTPSFISPMSASSSAYFVGHATRTAARALLRLSLWPAAFALWSSGPGGGQAQPRANDIADARVVDGKLTADGMEPLGLDQLAAVAHKLGLVTGVSIHVFNRWQWAEAVFDVPNVGVLRLPADALSVRYGQGAPAELPSDGFHFLARRRVFYPPVQRLNAAVTYSGMATIAEVAVDTASGEVKLLSHHSILDCGTQVVPELVSGQIQGGLAMGVGHALLEELPLYEDGPGDGTWNWNRYRLPQATDVAVWTQTSEVLPPLSEADPPKGMAEVVMIAIVPAIANAVNHAIGKRFYQTPITPEKILEALP